MWAGQQGASTGPLRLWGGDLESQPAVGRRLRHPLPVVQEVHILRTTAICIHTSPAQPSSLFLRAQAGRYVSEDGFELLTLLPLPPKCQDHMPAFRLKRWALSSSSSLSP